MKTKETNGTCQATTASRRKSPEKMFFEAFLERLETILPIVNATEAIASAD